MDSDILRPARRLAGALDRAYQRAYKACIPCRQRKAKCDLGAGSNGLPLGPPCARCRREKRECVFSEKKAWERRRKRAAASEEFSNGAPSSRTRQRISSSIRNQDEPESDVLHSADSPSGSQPYPYENPQQQSTSTLSSSMMRTVVSSGNDALNILFEAAAVHSQGNDPNGPIARVGNESTTPADRGSHHQRNSTNPLHIGGNRNAPVTFESPAKTVRPVEISQASQDVLDVWEACRFVKMGWFTAVEAVTFIDLFFKNMSRLSPILTDFYADHKSHYWLISRDPVLCSTILMISSRYHVLPGVGGDSRNFFIHHRLWQHCQQLVMRLTFGQERSSKSKIRTIGTIEALLLMSEWHPRSLHFPPEMDGWDSDLTTMAPPDSGGGDMDSGNATGGSENRWLEDMIEPARRSDQMSWMLLGAALSLAHEIGVFETENNNETACSSTGYEGFMSTDRIELRKQRVRQLLYVYVNQLAWRIGCMSLMPQSLNHAIPSGKTARGLSRSGDEWLKFMDSWMDLTKLAKSVTDMFFPSVTFARQQLHTGRYVGLLDHFRPLLSQWKEKHLQPHLLDKTFFDVLFIEYHFVHVYTHSVGMQAVVERVLADADPDNNNVELRLTTINPIDYEYIQEVINGCCQILQKVNQLAETGALRFSPVRIFLRITSSSIFLMKALSLGTRQSKLGESLDILELSIQALRSNALDDIHLGSRYATLLDMHVSRLRQKLLASSKSIKNSHESTRRSSMAPPLAARANDDNETSAIETTARPHGMPDMGFMPSLNDLAADDWLSLPFDPSMAPFGIGSGGHFPAYEGGALNFIWNLPS